MICTFNGCDGDGVGYGGWCPACDGTGEVTDAPEAPGAELAELGAEVPDESVAAVWPELFQDAAPAEESVAAATVVTTPSASPAPAPLAEPAPLEVLRATSAHLQEALKLLQKKSSAQHFRAVRGGLVVLTKYLRTARLALADAIDDMEQAS